MQAPAVATLVELGAVGGAALVVWRAPRLRTALWGGLQRCLAPLARRPWSGPLASAAVAVLGCAALGAWWGPVEPRVHDEFSYLLLADTFAEGRLTNPPHPLWEHFETFHVLQRPSYASKFPPAQGAALALGRGLGGDPLFGVWLGVAFLGTAIAWMLRAWMPPRWAALGGLVAVAQFGVGSYWGHSFWGGAIAAGGGALAFGGFRRLQRGRAPLGAALALGAGLAVLALARPWEGFLAGLALAGGVLVWLVGRLREGRGQSVVGPAAALVAVLAAAAGALGTYHRAVTGDPLRAPYTEHEEQYAVAPPFLWQGLREPPAYRAPEIERFYTGFCADPWYERRSARGFLAAAWLKAKLFGWFYVGAFLAVPLVVGARRWRRRGLAVPLAAAGLVFGAQLAVTWELPHYAAPVTGPVVLLAMLGLRRLATGRSIGRAIALSSLALVFLAVPWRARAAIAKPNDWHLKRAEAQRTLEATGERHVVFVRYDRDHLAHREWVYNAADVDAAPVVWARDRGPEDNRAVLEYYPDRRAWLVPLSYGKLPEEPVPYEP